MGFFDKRKNKDEEQESEVLPPHPTPPAHAPEVVRVRASIPPENKVTVTPASPPPLPPPRASEPSAEALVVSAVPDPKTPPAPPQASVAPALPEPAFGIDEAVVLMRQLPSRNIDLVMQVVKKTLESLRVDVPKIIEGAAEKEHRIEQRILSLKAEIEALESKIATHRKEISGLEAEQKEVLQVKERLSLAQKAEQEPSVITGSTVANALPPQISSRPQAASVAPRPAVNESPAMSAKPGSGS